VLPRVYTEGLTPRLGAGDFAAPDFHLDELERWITPGGDVIATYFKATGTFTGPFDPPGFGHI